jgi:hypothetical protein
MRNTYIFDVVEGSLFNISSHDYHKCDKEVVDKKRKICESRVA